MALSKLPGPVIPRPFVNSELSPRSQSRPRNSSWSIIIGTISVNRLKATEDVVRNQSFRMVQVQTLEVRPRTGYVKEGVAILIASNQLFGYQKLVPPTKQWVPRLAIL